MGVLAISDTFRTDFEPSVMDGAAEEARQVYESMKNDLLHSATAGRIPVPEMDINMRDIAALQDSIERAVKAAQRIGPFRNIRRLAAKPATST